MGGQTPLRKCCEYCKNVSMDIVDDKCIIRFLTVNEERARKLRV